MQDWTKMSPNDRQKASDAGLAAYRAMVTEAAEKIVAKLTGDHADERNRWHQLYVQYLHEYTCDHEAHTNPYNAIQTLIYSDHPCSGIRNDAGSDCGEGDEFPFAEFAVDAFEDDVNELAIELLEAHGLKIDSDDAAEVDGRGDCERCYYREEACYGELWKCQTCQEEYCEHHSHSTSKGSNVECVACERHRAERENDEQACPD